MLNMELRELESLTPSMPLRCATNCAIAPKFDLGANQFISLSIIAQIGFYVKCDRLKIAKNFTLAMLRDS